MADEPLWLTNSMEINPSWEANSCLADQEIPNTLRNPKVRHRVHSSASLGHIDLVDTPFLFI
jgi:hypothetical protein